MKISWWQLIYGILIGLLTGGTLWLVTSPPRGEAVRLLPPPTSPPIVVHVSGAVAQPGIYHLPAQARVQDAIESAGGLLPGADEHALNLAAFLEDGQKLHLPHQEQLPTPKAPTAAQPPPAQVISSTAAADVASHQLININTASLEELVTLPGIGPDKAGKIIAHREEYGPFEDITAIQEVSGIGPATFERIKELITVVD